MRIEKKDKRIIHPLKLPLAVRKKLPEAQKDYEKAIKRRIIFIFLLLFIFSIIATSAIAFL